MTAKLRRNAILVSGLALLFAWAFQFAKHDPRLRNIIPFGDDPYDAVGSFAFIAAPLLCATSLVRAFLPRLAGRSSAAIYTLRVQAAVIFCVLVTVASDLVAMARHTSMWRGAPGQTVLWSLLGTLMAASLLALTLVRDLRHQERGHYPRAAGICAAALLCLCFYPEKLIAGIAGHLFTVVAGDLLLFAPVAALVEAWLPAIVDPPSTIDAKHRRKNAARHARYLPVTIAAVLGVAAGAMAFFAEMNDGGVNPPLEKLLFVAAVYVGLGTAGLLIAYAFLGKLLGFVAKGTR